MVDNEWKFLGKPLLPTDIPANALGFIYIIRQVSTGKKYIGRKLLTSASTKMVAGKKKKIRKESDWKTYWSSSPFLKAYIKDHGTTDFTREVLTFCTSKGSLAYCEEWALYTVGALESHDWLNENIRAKVYRTWVKKDDIDNLRKAILLV
jgi:hypothetical protein